MKKLLLGVSILLSTVVVFGATVYAQTPKYVFSRVEPDLTYYTVNAGESIPVEFQVENLDVDRDMVLGFKTKGVVVSGEEMNMPLEWLTILPAERVKLQPGDQRNVSVLLTPPRDAEMGTYIFNVQARLDDFEDRSDGSGSGVNLSTAIGQKIMVKILPPIGGAEVEAMNYSLYLNILLLLVIIVLIVKMGTMRKPKINS